MMLDTEVEKEQEPEFRFLGSAIKEIEIMQYVNGNLIPIVHITNTNAITTESDYVVHIKFKEED